MLHQLECRGLSEALLLEEAVFRISVLLTDSKTEILKTENSDSNFSSICYVTVLCAVVE